MIKAQFHIQNTFVKDFEVPAVTICYNMGFNVSKTIEYNISSAWDFMVEYNYRKMEHSNMSIWKLYQEIAYMLNRDFEMSLLYDESPEIDLKVGENVMGDGKNIVKVIAVPTLYQV